MTERPAPLSSDAARSSPIGLWAFGLAVASTAAYFATSEGVRNFVAFVASIGAKAMAALGHGA